MTDSTDISGKVFVVTGANSGIGEAISREAARLGAKVVIDWVVHPEATDKIVADIKAAGGEAVGFQADVSKVSEIQRLVEFAVSTYGRIDVWVNNAGVEISQGVYDLDEAKFDWLMGINLKGAVFGTKLAATQMKQQGDGGVIVNITSTHEDWPMPSDLSYCVSKGGMRMLTRTAGVELGPDRIRVVGVGPGAILTPINAGDDAAAQAALRAAIPLGYEAEPIEIATVVCWAVSDAARYVTATTVMADGGLMQKPGAV